MMTSSQGTMPDPREEQELEKEFTESKSFEEDRSAAFGPCEREDILEQHCKGPVAGKGAFFEEAFSLFDPKRTLMGMGIFEVAQVEKFVHFEARSRILAEELQGG